MIKHLLGLFLLFILLPLSAQESPETGEEYAQNLQTIKGQIVDAVTKQPILGARVQSENMQYSGMTGEDGTFTIQIPDYLNLLQISASDYATIEYPLQGRSEIEVALYRAVAPLRTPQAITLDDNMVYATKGYIRTAKHSGMPGIGSSMFIRGYNSFNAGAQPLIVIDGVLFDNQYDRTSLHNGFILNPLANIEPEDIESIEIAENQYQYGGKAGNGVLLIHTKRGKDPVTRITVNTKFGYNQRPETTPVMNADQYRVYLSDMLNSYIKEYDFSDPISTLPFLNEDENYFDYKRYHNSNDWSKDVYRNSLTQSYNVGVSGGDNVALYHLSMGYTKANSTLKSNDFSRFNTRFNSDIDLTSKLGISFDLAYSQTNYDVRDDGMNEDATRLVTSPSILSLIKAPFLIPYEYSNEGEITDALSDSDVLSIANPVSIMNNGVGESGQTYLSLSVRPVYTFTNAFKIGASFNYSMNSLFEKYFRPEAGVPREYLDLYTVSRNMVKAQNAKQISLAANIFLNWNKQFNMHTVDVTGGWRFLTDTYKGEFGSGHNTASDLDQNLNGSLTYRQAKGYDDAWRSVSTYANVGYSLYAKYFLSASLSADASSRFGEDADLAFKLGGVNWGLYPSVNAAWLVTSEDFMRNLSFVDAMKLRAGYTITGNDNIPQAAALTYFSSIRYMRQYTGTGIMNIGNPTLKPETVKKATFGIDLNLLNNRLALSADLFYHTTTDLLLQRQFNTIAGKETYWANGGKLQNRGFEIAVDARVVELSKFRWDVGMKVARYKNKVTELVDGDYTTRIYGGEIRTEVGQPLGVFYGYKTNGVFATTAEAMEANLKIADGTGIGYHNFEAGDMKFADLHKDGIIDEKDKTVIGDPNPDFTGMFNTRFTYKKLSLNALFTFSYGNDVYNYVRSQMEAGSNLNNQTTALQNRWVNEGMQTDIPKLSYNDPMGNSRFSDRWIEDGSYLRLKSLSLSYELPVNTMFLSGITIWTSIDNLWTWTKYLGNDPEFSLNNSPLYQGIDAGMLSQGRTFYFGLKLNL